MDASFTLEKQMSRLKAYLSHIHDICRRLNLYFSVTPTAWYWRNRFRISKLFLDSSIALAEPLDPQLGLALNYEKWRSGSQQKMQIVRTIVSLNIEVRAFLTIKDIRYALGDKISADRIISALNHGIELGLVELEKEGRKNFYKITDKCADEVAERSYVMARHPAVIEQAKIVRMYDNLLDQTEMTATEEKRGKMTFSDHQSLLERIYWGDKGRRGRR